MNGLIKLTRLNGKGIYVNPLMISLFGESDEELTKLVGCASAPGATVIFIAGMMFQVRETEQEIIRASARLIDKMVKKQQDSVIALRNRLNPEEDWKSGEE